MMSIVRVRTIKTGRVSVVLLTSHQ
ncbi:hypothetical protein HID58_057602 [Brassica napus]|uniref:Uncharacterized protein n=1 Tax=Brassica napus TaxID=3708 RepID=A0ABQ8ARV1_BRANA|nr:hypothetical protein HID58_057602 [Brassica napus]